MNNLMEKAKKAYSIGDHKESLRNLLRLIELKMDFIWEFETGKAISSLCVARNSSAWEKETQIIIGSEDTTVYSLSLNKELLWKFAAEDKITSVIAMDFNKEFSDKIIIGSKDSYVYVLDIEGKLLWKYKIDKPVHCVTATRMGGKDVIIAGSFRGTIHFLEFMKGIFWEYSHKKPRAITGLCIAHLIHSNEHREVIAVTDSGEMLVFDTLELSIKGEFKLKGSLYGVLAKDIDNDGFDEIIVCSENAQVYCLDGMGRIKWQFQTKDSVYSVHCCDIDNNNDVEILLGTRDNYVYVLDSKGNFKWRYRTDHNVWSIFSDQVSHKKFYDLFAGLSNRKAYYYKLIDRKNTQIKIEKSYLQLLDAEQDEFTLLETLSKEHDEYLRKFAIENMVKFAQDENLRPKIYENLQRLLVDRSPLVRIAAIKELIKLSDYESELVHNLIIKKLSDEDNEDARKAFIESITQDYLRTIEPTRKNEIIETIYNLNEKWKKRDHISTQDLFDHAKEKFITGNYKEALKDFELLYRRGLDLIWKIKTKGFVCSLACADIDGDGYSEIIIASSKNILYVFDHIGQLRWSTEIAGFRNPVMVDDIDRDGYPEIILGCTDGSFIIFSANGSKKDEITFNEQINNFSLISFEENSAKDIVLGCVNGQIHCINSTGKEKWRFKTESHVLKICVKDIDGDGSEEIIAGMLNGHLVVLDGTGQEKWRWKTDDDIVSIAIDLFFNDSIPTIIIGTHNGHVYALDLKGNAKLLKDLKTTISDMNIVDINDDGEKEIVISTESKYIFILNKQGNEKIYDLDVGSAINCIDCADLNNDGHCDIIVGFEDENVHLYSTIKPEVIEKYLDDCKEKLSRIENKVNFYRKDILRFINDTLEMDYMSSKKILLLGYLGTGKSELLWEINSGCLGEKFIPVYISLQYIRWKDISSFLYRLSKEILNGISNRKQVNFTNYKNEFEKDYRKAFSSFIGEITQSLNLQSLLILFDDFEKLQSEVIKGNINREVFSFLEMLAETKRCSFIITSFIKTFELEKEYEGSFLSNSIIKNVNFINKFDARLVSTNYLTDYTENVQEMVEAIIKITGCQAHIIQVALDVIMKYLKKNQIRRLSTRDWKEINTRLLELVDTDLLNVWDNCSPIEQLLLSCLYNVFEEMSIEKDIKPVLKAELGVFYPFVSEHVLSDILKSLTEKSILDQIFTEDEIRYTFTIPLMRDWLRETKNPFEIINKNSGYLLRNLSLSQLTELNTQLKEQEKLEFFLSTIDFDKRRWDTIIKFSRMWHELEKGIAENQSEDIEKNIIMLYNNIKCFAHLFDFSIAETVDHHKMGYYRFKTPSITLKKLKDLLVMVIPKYEKLDETFYDSLAGLIIDQDAASNVFLILEFSDSPGFRRRCVESKLDLVLMNQEDLKNILLSRNYVNALVEQVILRQVDLVQFSPYVTMAPVEGKMFFGRLPEIRKIERQSDKCFSIVGARQLGKTSLLLKVRNNILEHKKGKTLYIDCETYNDPLRLCTDILRGLGFTRTSVQSINEFKSIIIEKCREENNKITLILDEIDEILDMDRANGEILFKTFRSLYQEGFINLVIAGYETLFIATKDIHSPLFNFLEVIRLGELDYESAAQLIIEPITDLGIEIQNEKMIVDEICKITACYPNLIQCMCKRIVEMIASEKRRKLTEMDVVRAKNDKEFQDYVIRSFYNPVSEMGKIIVLLILNTEEFGPYDIDIKLKDIGITLNYKELNKEIDNLCMLSVLTKRDKKFKFTLPYLATIFKKTMEIDLELEKLTKEMKNYDHQ